MEMKTLPIFFCFIIFVFLVGCNAPEEQQQPTVSGEETSPAEDVPVTTEVPVPGSDVEEKKVEAETSPESETSTGSVKEVTMEMYNWGITMNPVTLNKGDTVKLTVKVKDGRHQLAMPAFDVKTDELGAGEETTLTFVADEAGSFDYFCSLPCGKGHKDMRGKLVVGE